MSLWTKQDIYMISLCFSCNIFSSCKQVKKRRKEISDFFFYPSYLKKKKKNQNQIELPDLVYSHAKLLDLADSCWYDGETRFQSPNWFSSGRSNLVCTDQIGHFNMSQTDLFDIIPKTMFRILPILEPFNSRAGQNIFRHIWNPHLSHKHRKHGHPNPSREAKERS